jgi:hypothetical protein
VAASNCSNTGQSLFLLSYTSARSDALMDQCGKQHRRGSCCHSNSTRIACKLQHVLMWVVCEQPPPAARCSTSSGSVRTAP